MKPTKLKKENHEYAIEANGKKWTITINSKGHLTIHANACFILRPYGRILVVDQENQE